jgi:hypothetical protein
MSRSNFSRLVVTAFALLLGIAVLTDGTYGGGKGKGKDKGDEKSADKGGPNKQGGDGGKKVGQEQIVHGCIVKVVLASGTTLGTVEFTHPKWGGIVKVVETGTTKTEIEVCGKTKTLAELKTLVEAVKTGENKFCGIARIDNRTSLKATKIIVCNDGD